MANILVTGASGFIGCRVVEMASSYGFQGKALYRNTSSFIGTTSSTLSPVFEELLPQQDLSKIVADIDYIIHCAALANQMQNVESRVYDDVNYKVTINLAKEAANAGVKRFIFISTIKVNGEWTDKAPFTEEIKEEPKDPYGLSKYKAEQGLLELAKKTRMQVVIIRPPLVFGPKVKANFASMMSWVDKEIPLPLGAIHQPRSLIYIDNLVDFIFECCVNLKAKNQVFLISNGQDISLSNMLKSLASCMDKKSYLLPVPVTLLDFIGRICGKKAVTQRLINGLHVDISKALNELNWQPKISLQEGFQYTVDAYKKN